MELRIDLIWPGGEQMALSRRLHRLMVEYVDAKATNDYLVRLLVTAFTKKLQDS